MRQMFTSPRLENVEAVAKLFTDAGIDNKISEGRGYKKVSRREFSYVEKKNDTSNQPAVWVIKSDDYKRAREMLHGMGLIDATAEPSYLPESLQFKEQARPDAARRLSRVRIVLLFAVGAMAAWMVFRMVFQS